MEHGDLRLDWHRFFCGMTAHTEVALARYLADIGLSLGEYMEIMEEAYLETSATSVEEDLSSEALDARAKILARQRLQRYARAKRRFLFVQRAGGHRMLLFPAIFQGTDLVWAPNVSCWMIDPVDRDSLRNRNRRLIRAMRNEHI